MHLLCGLNEDKVNRRAGRGWEAGEDWTTQNRKDRNWTAWLLGEKLFPIGIFLAVLQSRPGSSFHSASKRWVFCRAMALAIWAGSRVRRSELRFGGVGPRSRPLQSGDG